MPSQNGFAFTIWLERERTGRFGKVNKCVFVGKRFIRRRFCNPKIAFTSIFGPCLSRADTFLGAVVFDDQVRDLFYIELM